MRKINSKVYIEHKYPGVQLGVVVSGDGLLLVDSPLRAEDAKEWLSTLAELGTPRYIALLDAHPDRVLGARAFDVPVIAQDRTLEVIREWADTFKGGLHPIGAEADRLKRVTGLQRAAPEVVFSEQMDIRLGKVHMRFVHRPGPQPGAAWMLLPHEKVGFIGDAVVLDEPPYVGRANLPRWFELLDELRSPPLSGYQLFCAQGGPVERSDINAMGRFLRKVEHRLVKLNAASDDDGLPDQLAAELMDDFKVGPTRIDLAMQRLRTGLLDLSSDS